MDLRLFVSTEEANQIFVKPLSVNAGWQGRRFKNKYYREYEDHVNMLLPEKIYIPEGDLKIYFEFGLSSRRCDWDNYIKMFQDILAKTYDFEDHRIMEGHVKKIIVKKGEEYLKFSIEKQDESLIDKLKMYFAKVFLYLYPNNEYLEKNNLKESLKKNAKDWFCRRNQKKTKSLYRALKLKIN